MKCRNGGSPNVAVVWPDEQNSDAVDHACGLSREYKSVYVNLNPLTPEYTRFVPAGETISVRKPRNDCPVLLYVSIDVDAHNCPKELAREQKNAIKARIGPPLIESDTGRGDAGSIQTRNLPNDFESDERVKRYLEQLKTDFSCVDASVHTAGRLTRCTGTLNKTFTTVLLN